jgi:hypothetical protein
MTEGDSDELTTTVENMHGCKATLVQSVPQERASRFDGMGRIVHVFDLAGHPDATRAHA